MSSNIIFEALKMNKRFGPTIALRDVDFKLCKGEIRGLVGENGSGKSTIMSIAAGMQNPTSGLMFYHGRPWLPSSMVDAQEKGISMILQEANTISNVKVAQNIFAGHEKDFSNLGFIDMGEMVNSAQKLLDSFGITHIKAQDSINKYSFEDRKLIEIVRCVTEKTEILVVDETTTALSHEGRDILYGIMKRFAWENKSVVFISHDMDEILDQCTVLTVLRDGDIIGDITAEEMGAAKLDSQKRKDVLTRARYMMVGREIGEKYYRSDSAPTREEEVLLQLKNLSFGPIRNFSLELHAGEIVGMGGLSGCGMHDIGRAAFGLEKLVGGDVLCKGLKVGDALSAIQKGIGYISKNRDLEALILSGSIKDNISLPSLDGLSRMSFVSPSRVRKLADEQIDTFSIKCYSGNQWVNTLSGGNKQKVSFAKWSARGSQVLIMDCPTRGVDVGVKQAMYALMEEMKNQGKAILMISEELSELIGMSDRLVIMKDNRITREFQRSPDLKQTDIIEYMV